MINNMKKVLMHVYTNILLVRNSIFDKFTKEEIQIHDIEKTINLLIKNQSLSICRFGDGEFMLMYGRSIKFQKKDSALSTELKHIIKSDKNDLMIALPDVFENNINYTNETNIYWKRTMAHYKYKITELIDTNKIYGNAFISRPYMNWKDKKNADERFISLFKLWENKDILIVEGNNTRSGMGNDIFSKVKSIKRIVVPSQNAFSKIEEILEKIYQNYDNELVLISCGPTANVIVYRLFLKGIRSIDLGHFDIEYEWYKKQVTSKINILGKDTSEVVGGDEFLTYNNEDYDNQIIANIQ